MKRNLFVALAITVVIVALNVNTVQAQHRPRRGGAHGLRSGKLKSVAQKTVTAAKGRALGFGGPTGSPIIDSDGRVQPQAKLVRSRGIAAYAAKNRFTPAPVFTYSPAGLRAGHTHAWNQDQQNAYSWHGGYNSWRFGEPTAVVVPPTAAYQSTYAWGVGQTRSTPIHHQFGRGGGSAGGVGGGTGQNAPYFPWSTDQFGYYPVRANW